MSVGIRDIPGCGRRGFTLVELLVVIGVIALLTAVLLPAIGRAKAAGNGAVSLSRMRQVATGWAIYAYDEDDVIVPGQPGRFPDEADNLYDVGNGRHYRPRWFAAMGAKAGFYAYDEPSVLREDEHSKAVDNEIFLCPVVPDWVSTRNHPYGYNFQFLGNARFVNNNAADGFIRYPVRTGQVRSPSATVMFASCVGTAGGKAERARTVNRTDGSRDPDLLAEGGHGYALDPPRLPGNNDYADRRNRSPEHRSAPHARYLGRAHAAFCDGSVRAMTLQELGYEVAPDGRVLVGGATATNRLFSGDGTDRDPPTLSR